MADQGYSFAQARTRLEEIVAQVRKKDISLEQSLDLLEEGVRLANLCTELSDHTEWRSVAGESAEEAATGAEAATAEGVSVPGEELSEDAPAPEEAAAEEAPEGAGAAGGDALSGA